MMWKVFLRLKSWSETSLTAEEAVLTRVAFEKTKGSQGVGCYGDDDDVSVLMVGAMLAT